MFSLEELFCCVDDFCQTFEPQWEGQLLGNGLQRRRRDRSLCLSEIMTILIGFHQSRYRNFKIYYQELVQRHLQSAFPGLVSYGRFALVDAKCAATVVRLCALLLRFVQRHQFYGLHQPKGLP